jgi:hypothetical protein
MGLFIVICMFVVGAGLIGLFLSDKEFALIFILVPAAFCLAAAFVITNSFRPSFEEEQFVAFDKTAVVSTLINSDGKEVYAFDNLGKVMGLNEIQFNEVILSDQDKMTVRIVEKYTPRNFWHFKTTTRKTILMMPKRG